MFAKKLSELTAADIQSVVDRKIQEDQEVEFKKTLPTRDGSDDRWIKAGDEIGSIAKREIAKELIAFANSNGGTLILGISEDGERRASGYNLLPKCRELAERLATSVASSTDPKLYGIESAGVEIDKDQGVVVFRVQPSARAPHRDTDTRESYYRSGEKSEPMEMHRIQMMSVEKWRGLQLVESRLHSRPFEYDRHLEREFMISTGPGQQQKKNVLLWISGCRATAVPIERVFIRDIAKRESLKLADAPLAISKGNGRIAFLHRPKLISWTPILRGIRYKEDRGDWAQYEERTILSDGLIEIKRKSSEFYAGEDGESSRHLAAAELLRPIAQFLVMVECYRNVIGRPDLEFAMSIEWRVPPRVIVTLPDESGYWGERPMSSSEEVNLLPDLAMPSRRDIAEFWGEVQREFFQSFGRSYGNIFLLDFEMAISHVLERSNAV